MPTVERDKIIFDSRDWFEGLHPQYGTSVSGNQKLTNKLSFAQSFNPYRNFGYASPGYNPTDVTNVSVVDTVIRDIVIANSIGYGIGGDNLHKISLSNGALTSPVFKTISGTGVVGDDVIVYNANLGGTKTQSLFFSWYDGTDGDIGRMTVSSESDDPDFMSTTPAGAAVLNRANPIPMIVGSDDILYFSDGNSLHAYDGATGNDGTLSKDVLVLPNEYIIKGFAKISPDTLAIFAYSNVAGSSFYRGKATVFFWDYLSDTFYRIEELDDNFVDGIFEYQGTIGCFTQGRRADLATGSRDTKMKIFDGNQFNTILTYIGNAPINGGVDVIENKISWNADGVVYSYDSPFLGLPKVLNKIGKASGSTSGALKQLTSTLTLVSSGTTTSGGLQTLNSNYYGQSLVSTSLAKPNFPNNKIGKITKVKIKFAKTSSGGRNLTIQLKDRTQTLSTIVNNLSTIDSTNIQKTYHENTSNGLFGTFDDLKLVLSWGIGSAATDAPIVDSVEVYYKLKNISV